MKMRLLVTLAGFAIGFVLPVLAQEQNMVDPEVRQQIEAVLKMREEAINKNDAAAVAALYTQYAASIRSWESEGGLASGQQAIEKRYATELASSPGELVNSTSISRRLKSKQRFGSWATFWSSNQTADVSLFAGEAGVLGTSERKVRLSHRQRLLRRCTSYSWSTIGLRNGRSSPRATVSGIANEYRPNMLMWSWISGESLATSAS
jgi:hypothetical protein